MDGSSSTNPQSQTISCTLHLDPADSVVEEQADACSCYDQSECEDECAAGTDNCDDNATCLDTDQSFLCACNDGYSGDGITCDQQTAIWLLWGYTTEYNIGHANQDGIFTDVQGGLTFVEVGEFGTFGVNLGNALYYKKGTRNNPYAIGPNLIGWQLLKLSQRFLWPKFYRNPVLCIYSIQILHKSHFSP